MKNIILCSTFLVTAPLLAGAEAFAAEAEQASDRMIQDIIVTAEKRTESAQTTPIAMSVLGADEIAQKGVVDIQSLAVAEPSVIFSSFGGLGYLTVRGIASQDVSEIGDPAVPVAVDDFTTTRSYALMTSLYDLQRIEVLRGPQGTLYGRNAVGGVVNIITQKPTKDFGAGVTAELGNYSARNFNGYLNLPITDTLQVRISGSSRYHDGYRKSLPSSGQPAGEIDDEDVRSIRVQAAWSPTENFNAWVLFETTRIGGTGGAPKNIDFVSNPDQVNHPGDISHDMPDLGDSDAYALYGPVSQDIDDKVVKWKLEYAGLPGGLSVTYLGGYDWMDWRHVSSAPTSFGRSFDVPIAFIQHETPETMSHELRITSDSQGALFWQAGLYYYRESSKNLTTRMDEYPFSTEANTLLDFRYPLVKSTSKAAFAQASYKINDQHKITLGGRYTEDTKLRTGTLNNYEYSRRAALGLLGPVPPEAFLNIPQDGHSKDDKFTYHIGYDWTPTDRNLIYAKFDSGYKAGGFASCGTYKPEEVKTAEIGTKNRFAGNRIQINAAGFYTKYKNQQVSGLSSACNAGPIVENAGKSTIYGIEANMVALLGESDKIDVSASWLHARFDSFIIAPPTGNAATSNCSEVIQDGPYKKCQLAGNSLTQSPDLTLSMGYEHDFRLPDDSNLNVRVEGRFQSEQYFDYFNFNSGKQEGYALLNAYMTYSRSDQWKIGLFVRNLTDKTYLVQGSEYASTDGHAYRYSFGAPRTYGVNVSAMF